MNSGDLTSEQIKTLQEQIKPAFLYLKQLVQRMQQRGFAPDDEILKAARGAFDRLHDFSVRLHYLCCDASKREFEAERKAKGSQSAPDGHDLRTYRLGDRKVTLPHMAKRKPKLGTLTPRSREILAFVFNSIAFKSHDQNCDVDSLAAHLGTKPGTLRRTLAKMADAGYVTVEGGAEYVYPTVAALQHQEPWLTETAARALLKRLHRRG